MKSKRGPLRWFIPPGAIGTAIVVAVVVALYGWMLYHAASRGCIRGVRGSCDPAGSFPPRHAIHAAP